MKTSKEYVYGRRPVAELLRQRPHSIRRLFVVQERRAPATRRGEEESLVQMAQAAGVVIEAARAQTLDGWLPNRNHQGVVAEVEPFAYTPLSRIVEQVGPDTLIVVLDCIQDPHNLGALARSALAMGADALVIPQDRAAQVTDAAYRTSAGALATLPVARVVNIARALDTLIEAGLRSVGASLEAHTAPYEVDLRGPLVLVLGNEERGMRAQVAKRCAHLVAIPMQEIGSLNASAAGAICLYEVLRQRAGGPDGP